jgi:hypothetical protein
MAYTPPTPAELKLHWTAFAAVDDTIVQYNIDRAARSVDASWTEGDYTVATELLACHYMTLAGLGTGTEAEINANGMAGFSMIRSGQLTLQRAATSGGAGGEVPDQWSGSAYGRQFYWLLKQNKPAVAVTNGNTPWAMGGWPMGYPWYPY